MGGGLGCLPRAAYAGVYRSFRTKVEMPACLLLAYVGTYLTQGKSPPATSSLYVRRACAGDKAEREVWGEEEEEDKLSRSEWRRGRGRGEIWMAANVGIEREEGGRDSFGGGNAYGLCGLGRGWRGQSESGGASPPLRQWRGSTTEIEGEFAESKKKSQYHSFCRKLAI